MSDQQEIANLFREMADNIEAGDIEITGFRFGKPTLNGEEQELTVRFDHHAVMDWYRQFWEAAR